MVRRDRTPCVWSRIATGTGRRRGGRRIPRHVGEFLAGVRRPEYGAAVRTEAVFAVLIRAAEEDLVGMARRRHDEVVVPALTRAVVERRVVRVGAIGAGQVLPTDVARAVEELAHGARRIDLQRTRFHSRATTTSQQEFFQFASGSP